MTDKQNEGGLKSCPFCGDSALLEGTGDNRFWIASCVNIDCYVQPSTDTCSSKSEARASWNHRAGEMAEWTKEVPTEEGLYFLAIKYGDADWYAIVVEVEHSLGEYYVRSHLFENNVYQDMFQCWCDYETNTENIMAADDCEVRWRKIPTPPLPGKEGM